MSEKGGKGFKSSLKSTPSKHGSSGGKDDNAKRGKKVQFEPKGSTEPRYKVLNGSDDHFRRFAANGGKVDKGGKAGKTSLPLELKADKELPENAKCLMDCEAAQILEGIQDQMVVLSEDPTIKIPVSFDRGLQYAKNGSYYTNPLSVRPLLECLKKHGVSDGEMCVIANVCPESMDEVFALVPSLKGKRDLISQPLQDALTELWKLKRSR
ncbi:PREDICTED: DNA-directed RNA polymerases IV and V subunit 4 isoform X2 [Tarenaya hassleriana]|uniref:DNA-directed RNA polymerases IV and V subunit 4 isoform X2 n=1 Tax=Tarenaya hassleriana TaxID=28532 RepID=UPI00053C7756|nr:PREDICTED: DNA-directed RNA polymerases IV and V subunit 4 isoform X2 [Tarenaya hassleriana]